MAWKPVFKIWSRWGVLWVFSAENANLNFFKGLFQQILFFRKCLCGKDNSQSQDSTAVRNKVMADEDINLISSCVQGSGIFRVK